MDIVQRKNEEEFHEFFGSLLERIDNKPETLFDSIDCLFKETEVCSGKGDAIKEGSPVVASAYYFSGAFLCLWFLDRYEVLEPVLQRGETMIGQARAILPEDGEYHLVEIFFKLFDLRSGDSLKDYQTLKQLHQECPSFKLITGSLMKTEWLEDTYNRLFEGQLSGLIDTLPTDKLSLIEEAVEMLKSFPGIDSKLKAYSYLASLDFAQNKLDESLRVAKLGVELLGTSFDFDSKNPLHELWAVCWTLVGRINRTKGEYDFAMSVFEKGQMLGIVPCIRQLAEMYRNGEGEDADIAESEKLVALADSIEEKRKQEEREEQERLRIEEEKRQEEIRRKEEEFRIAEEMKARHREILIRKGLLIGGIVAALVLIVWCVVSLSRKSILDRIAKYEKAHYAILDARTGDDSPYVVVMNKNGIFVDNMSHSRKVLSVGDTIQSVTRKCVLDDKGLSVSVLDADPLVISSSKGLFFKRVTDQAYLITKSRVNNPLTSKVDVSDGILVLTSEEVPKAIRFNTGALDGAGNVLTYISGDILPLYEKELRKSFTSQQYSEIVRREYGKYSLNLITSLKDGTCHFDEDVSLPNLDMKVSPGELGRSGLRNQMQIMISAIFRDEFVKAMFDKATALTGVKDNSRKRLSPDDRFTFVIVPDYYKEDKNRMALFRINNQNNVLTLVNSGVEIAFRDYSIYVKKHSKFLFLFDSYTEIYYDYYGNRTN